VTDTIECGISKINTITQKELRHQAGKKMILTPHRGTEAVPA
jgi:hypothetical protein